MAVCAPEAIPDERIEDLVEAQVGAPSCGIDIRELGNRWASCSPNGNLAFHWKCMMAPQTIIDHIVTHELCNL